LKTHCLPSVVAAKRLVCLANGEFTLEVLHSFLLTLIITLPDVYSDDLLTRLQFRVYPYSIR